MLDMKDKVPIDPAPVDVGARFDSRAAAEQAVKQLAADDVAAPAQVEILAADGRMRVARGAHPVIVHATDHKQARRARQSLAEAGGKPYLKAGTT
jgi:hypothetical protein